MPRRTVIATGRVENENGAPEVDAFMARLEHPRKEEIQLVRAVILGLNERIRESVKWNAPSFCLEDHFATFKLRPVETLQVVLHTGAKVRAEPRAMRIDDPHGLLKWAAPDRCVLTLSDPAEVRSRQGAVADIVKQWIAQL